MSYYDTQYTLYNLYYFSTFYYSQARLAEAKSSLEETLRILNEAKTRLREVEEGIATLQAKYEETTAKKEELANKCSLCTARLERAEKVSVDISHIIKYFFLFSIANWWLGR